MQGRRISYRKWSVSHKPVFDGTKPYALPKDEEADKMDDKDAAPTSPAKGGQPLSPPVCSCPPCFWSTARMGKGDRTEVDSNVAA